MDSLTQITLGAACGELVLGRRIGNKAMLWGAIAGTIPDLDVLARLWMPEIDALAVHRGLSHSLLFAVVVPWVLGWTVHQFYNTGCHARRGVRLTFFGMWSLGILGFGGGLVYLARSSGFPVILAIGIATATGISFLIRHWWTGYVTRPAPPPDAGYPDWVLLFFWAILTHPLLDAFTAFGTQLFYPFSDYRVAFNVVAIIDPLYTVPFLGMLILASTLARTRRLRHRLTLAGVLWSSAYLFLCTVNKHRIDGIFQRSLEDLDIPFTRFTTSPVIFSNLLWQGVAETDSAFYLGTYSLLDPVDRFKNLDILPHHQVVPESDPGDRNLRILKWFTKGYFFVAGAGDGTYRFNDLRYGVFGEDGPLEDRFVFSFRLTPGPHGLEVKQIQPDNRDMGQDFSNLWQRMMGRDLVADRRHGQ